MKARLNTLSCLGVRTAALLFIRAFTTQTAMHANPQQLSDKDDKLRQGRKILDSTGNACHHKPHPFRVFTEKNLSKRAKKIHRVVCREGKIPKGDEIRLTNEEFMQLEKWLFTENIR